MSDYTSEQITWLNAHIAGIANQTARTARFRNYVEGGDLQGVLWEWAMKHESKVQKWFKLHEGRELERLLGKVFSDEARMFARREKANLLGYKLEDEFFYSAGVLKDLLPVALAPQTEWLDPPTDHGTGGRSTKALSEGNNWLATLADVSRAVGLLSLEDQSVLTDLHLGGIPTKDIARRDDITVRGVEQRQERALKRLWNALGGPQWLEPKEKFTHGVVGRKSISNARANAVTNSDLES